MNKFEFASSTFWGYLGVLLKLTQKDKRLQTEQRPVERWWWYLRPANRRDYFRMARVGRHTHINTLKNFKRVLLCQFNESLLVHPLLPYYSIHSIIKYKKSKQKKSPLSISENKKIVAILTTITRPDAEDSNSPWKTCERARAGNCVTCR